jgi:hypothetical protein
MRSSTAATRTGPYGGLDPEKSLAEPNVIVAIDYVHGEPEIAPDPVAPGALLL